MTKAALFDLDGTLVDSREDIASSVNRMLRDMGYPARDEREIYGYIGGGVHKLVLASLPPESVTGKPASKTARKRVVVGWQRPPPY